MSTSSWLDLVWTDIVGRTHLVRTTHEACESGGVEVRLADVVSGYGDGEPVVGPDRPLELRPDLSTERVLPWDGDVTVCLADLYEEGEPSPYCSRSFLREVAGDAARRGYTVRAAVELEFYLLDPATRLPIYDQIDNYSLSRTEGEETIAALRNEMRQMGIGIEASNPEYGGGQFEVNISHAELLAAADHANLARHFTHTLAHRRGLLATYLSKPWTDQSSSGVHVHQSLWSGERNVFYGGEESLSPEGLAYLAGVLESMPDFALLGSPTPNGFHRRADGSFAPTVVAWATDNRTTSVRVIYGGESATRIEHRDGGSDCNLYLTMGAQVLAGLDGIDRQASPPASVAGNAYEQDLPTLPRTYLEAYERLQGSELARRLIPSTMLETYLAVLAEEVELSITSAADWERERYAEVPLP